VNKIEQLKLKEFKLAILLGTDNPEYLKVREELKKIIKEEIKKEIKNERIIR
jgi:hypothetical protein